nr:sulfite oxidase [Mycolicibacterium chubuense]
MRIHERSPFNAESPLGALTDDITAVDAFYSRNHGPIPELPIARWRLRVDGLVATPRTFTFDEISTEFGVHAVTATLQCAGNRRAELADVRDIPGEDLWGSGAVSTAEWRGARLADVLDAVGADRTHGAHVCFEAPDVSALADPPQVYGGSIPLAKALSPEVLLAWGMNCEPLSRVHGGPVRVIVPGYVGARSVKWVTAVTVTDQPSDNYFQASAYRILPPADDAGSVAPGAGIPLSTLPITCDFLSHRDGDRVPDGLLTVTGYALAGDGRDVARVDVSLDDGRSWHQAELDQPRSRWSWRHWSLTMTAAPGPLRLTARAFDDTAATQPESAAALWNPKGYANNSWPRIHLSVG